MRVRMLFWVSVLALSALLLVNVGDRASLLQAGRARSSTDNAALTEGAASSPHSDGASLGQTAARTVQRIPEPFGIALFGIVLLGAAVRMRRSNP